MVSAVGGLGGAGVALAREKVIGLYRVHFAGMMTPYRLV